MINRLQDVGVKSIEAANFASAKFLPQLADAEEVLKRINRKPGVTIRAVTASLKGTERVVAAKDAGYGVDSVGMPITASDAHTRANVHMSLNEHRTMTEKMVQLCKDHSQRFIGGLGCCFGCPITGDVPISLVLELAKWWKELGAEKVCFGDTTGQANPKQVSYFYKAVLDAGFEPEETLVHFHDTRGAGIANCLVALQAGMKNFECTLGAVGGQPASSEARYQLGNTGNTCTEDLVCMLEEMGVSTGIDVNGIIEAGHLAEKFMGRELRSNVIKSGPVLHQPHSEHWLPPTV